MATYHISYQFSLSEKIDYIDQELEINKLYDKECIAEVQVSTNVEKQCLNAARLDFIDDYGMLAPFSLNTFGLLIFVKKV
jgi:hypothetical protein